MWESEGEECGYFVSNQFKQDYDQDDSAAWMVEYAWGGGVRDSCSGTPPNRERLVSLGLNSELVHNSDYYFTRLHDRCTPQQATEELMLYQTNILVQSQVRYIQYEPYLEDRFPVCGFGMVEVPQTCEEDFPEPSSEIPDLESDDGRENLEDKENKAEDREGKCC